VGGIDGVGDVRRPKAGPEPYLGDGPRRSEEHYMAFYDRVSLLLLYHLMVSIESTPPTVMPFPDERVVSLSPKSTE
jgi:hypothetical protein